MESEDIINTSSETDSQNSDSTVQLFVDSLNPSISIPELSSLEVPPTMSTTDPQSIPSQSNNWANIPKLTSSTFFDWKRRLETTLGARRLSCHILEDELVP